MLIKGKKKGIWFRDLSLVLRQSCKGGSLTGTTGTPGWEQWVGELLAAAK